MCLLLGYELFWFFRPLWARSSRRPLLPVLAVGILFNVPPSPGSANVASRSICPSRPEARDRRWLVVIIDIFVLLSAVLSFISCAQPALEIPIRLCVGFAPDCLWQPPFVRHAPLHDFMSWGALCGCALSRGLADQAVSPLNCSEISQALPAIGFQRAHQGLESSGCGALSTRLRASWSGVSLCSLFFDTRRSEMSDTNDAL